MSHLYQEHKPNHFLTGKILIATPMMDDTRFAHTIVLICQHDDEHAVGIVLNRHVSDVSLNDLFESLQLFDGQTKLEGQILDGGPCQKECGFVLHSDDWLGPESSIICKGIALNSSKQILNEIVCGNPPRQFSIALGYSGWGAGQLEDELAQNIWLVANADCEIVFSKDHGQKWQKMMKKIGVDPARLIPFVGRA